MAISVFDIFKIGIAPSSIHTVGPMRAARMFAKAALAAAAEQGIKRVVIELYGSLGATGKGHGTDTAVMLGLAGHDPETVDVDQIDALLADMHSSKNLALLGRHALRFDEAHDIVYKPFRTLPFHPNGMRCMAMDESGSVLLERSDYSVGGGFVGQGDAKADPLPPRLPDMAQLPRPFRSGEDLLRLCLEHKCSISDVMRANEREW